MLQLHGRILRSGIARRAACLEERLIHSRNVSQRHHLAPCQKGPWETLRLLGKRWRMRLARAAPAIVS